MAESMIVKQADWLEEQFKNHFRGKGLEIPKKKIQEGLCRSEKDEEVDMD